MKIQQILLSAPILLSKWMRKTGTVLTASFFLHQGTTSYYNGSQDNTVSHKLIFKKIQLERDILFAIFACQDPNSLTYVSGRTYTLCLLSLCRATSCLLFFFLNSLALWYQHLMTT